MFLEIIGEMIEAIGSSSGSRRSNDKFRCPHCGKIAFLVIAAIVVGLIYVWPAWSTKAIVQQEVTDMCNGVEITPKQDGWGKDMEYKAEEITDPLATQCTVRSAGRDGQFNTEDDITKVDHNIHVAKSVGRWAGNRAADAAKGFMEAFKGSPPHEE